MRLFSEHTMINYLPFTFQNLHHSTVAEQLKRVNNKMLGAIFLPSDNTDNIQKTNFHTNLVDNSVNKNHHIEPYLNLENLNKLKCF